MQHLIALLIWTLLASCLLPPLKGGRDTAGLVVITDIETRPALEQAMDEHARATGGPSGLVFLDPNSLAARTGEADLVVWHGTEGRDGEVDPLVDSDRRKVLAEARLAIVTRQGNPAGVGKLSDVAVGRLAVAAEPWSSLHRATVPALDATPLEREVSAGRVRRVSAPGELLSALRAGEIDAALGWDVLEGLEPCEIDVVALPESIAPAVPLHAAVTRRSRRAEEALRFLDFLASPVGQAVLGHHGYAVELHRGGAAAYDALAAGRLATTYPMTARRLLNESGITSGLCLDIGCGTGQLDVALARASELRIIGVDIDPAMIEVARERIAAAGLAKRVGFVVGDVHRLPFEDDHADVVISRGSLPFWKDRVTALREIHRVLRPGGFALIGGRYLFTPPRYLVSDEELRRDVAATGLPGMRVIRARGQWVEIRGPRWETPAVPWQSRMAMLAGRVVIDYGITEGRCAVIGNRFTGLEIELARQTALEVTGILENGKALDDARKGARDAGLASRVTFRVAPVDALPLEEKSVDLVVSVAALPFWKDRGAAFREIHRVLRPGGVAFLGGRYLHMPARFRVSADELRRTAAATGIPRIRVIEDMGQWVEIRGER